MARQSDARNLLSVEQLQKLNARAKLGRQIRSGKITRPSYCSACEIFCKPHAHHKDYAHPLRVVWLCKSCHTRIHSGAVIDLRELNYA